MQAAVLSDDCVAGESRLTLSPVLAIVERKTERRQTQAKIWDQDHFFKHRHFSIGNLDECRVVVGRPPLLRSVVFSRRGCGHDPTKWPFSPTIAAHRQHIRWPRELSEQDNSG